MRQFAIPRAARVIAGTGLLLALFVFGGGCARFAAQRELPLVFVLPKYERSDGGEIACGLAGSAALALRGAYGSAIRVCSVPEALSALCPDSLGEQAYHEQIARRTGADLVVILSAAGPWWKIWAREGGGDWSPRRAVERDWQPLVEAVAERLGLSSLEEAPTSDFQSGGTVGTESAKLGVPGREEAERAGEFFLRAAGLSAEPVRIGDELPSELVGWAAAEARLRVVAELRERSEDVTAALHELGELLTLSWRDTASFEWVRLRGAYFVQAERWSQAEHWLSAALRRNPADGRVYYWLARLHPTRLKQMGVGNWEQTLQRSIELNPLLFDARLYLADLYFHNQRRKNARRLVDELLRINPVHEAGLMMSGRLYIAENDIPNTLRTYKRVLDRNPGNASAYYNLGIVYFHTGHLEDAEKLFRRAIEINGYPDAHLYLGLIYEKQGQMDAAIAEYRARIRLRKGPDDPFADQARRRLFELLHAAADSTVAGSQ